MRIIEGMTENQLREKIIKVEEIILSQAVKAFLDGRLMVENNIVKHKDI